MAHIFPVAFTSHPSPKYQSITNSEDGNIIDDKGIKALSNALWKSLQNLHLSNNFISDAGLDSLAHSMFPLRLL